MSSSVASTSSIEDIFKTMEYGPAPEDDWEGYKEVLRDSERLKEFEWNR